jgi:hypothetical protein
MTILEVMVRLRTCVKKRESGRPRSLAVIYQCLFMKPKSLGLGSDVQNCHISRDTEATVLKYAPRLVSINRTMMNVVAPLLFVAC